jgi:hypothetical protein
MVYDISVMMTYVYNATFNCYFAFEEQITASTYESLIKDINLVLNILFNAGEQYEDIRDLYNYWGTDAWAGYTGTQY